MAWESRKGNLYYYRKERVGGKVVSVYVGKGVLAEQCEQEVAESARQREQHRQERMEWAQIESHLQALRSQTEAELMSAGPHRPNWGPWRRKRS